MIDSKEALETLGNVKVAVTTIRSGITHFKTLKEQYEAEFEVLERELFIRKKLKDFDVYQIQLEKLEKENKELRNSIKSWNENGGNLLKENIKLKEVIKIIITKGVNELFLKNTKTSDDYNKIIKQLEYFDELTQEEYELLKEVLK